MTLSCPYCGLRKQVPAAKVPDRPIKVSCPKCNKVFTFRGDRLKAGQASPPLKELHPTLQAAITKPPAERPPRDRLLRIGALLTRSWETFKRRLTTLIGVALLALVLAGVSSIMLGWSLNSLQNLLGDNLVVTLLTLLVSVGFALLVFSAIGAAMTYAVVDDDLGVRQSLGYGIQNFLGFLWVFSLQGFIISGGFLAFLLPGLLFSAWFIFGQFVFASENVRGMEALLKSRAYVRGYELPVLGRILLVGLLGSAISAVPFIGPLLSLLVAPFTLVFYHELYLDLRELKGSISFPVSRGEKAKWLVAGAAGYVIVPLLGLLLLGPSLLQFLDSEIAPGSSVGGFEAPAETPRPTAPAEGSAPVAGFGRSDRPASPSAGEAASYPSPLANEAEVISPPSTAPIVIPAGGDPDQPVMVYVYALNYRGEVRLNGEEFYRIRGEKDMNYNYSAAVDLRPGRNLLELDYQALPDPWMTALEIKVYHHDWDSGMETVYGERTFADPGARRQIEIVREN